MLEDLVRHSPIRSVSDVVALMTAIDARLPDDDGLKWFNRLYLLVTVAVRDALTSTTYADPAFMTQLDVVFANLYFSAISVGEADPSRAPAAWRPVLGSRRRPGITRLQSALAGMNAHINRDLPQGIVEAFQLAGGDLLDSEVRHRDFDRVNPLLAQVEGQVKPEFSVGLVGTIDVLAGRLDDTLAMWNVAAAREAAWTHAQVLWSLRRSPRLRDDFFQKLDGLTGLAGQGLLLPIGAATRRRGPA